MGTKRCISAFIMLLLSALMCGFILGHGIMEGHNYNYHKAIEECNGLGGVYFKDTGRNATGFSLCLDKSVVLYLKHE